MKTSEFIKKIEEIGYVVSEGMGSVRVFRDLDLVAIVYKNKVNQMDTLWEEDVPHDLFDVLVNYASTPIEERKEDKKYYLYNPVQEYYFNYYVEEEEYHWSDPHPPLGVQTQFTEEEIKNHKFRDIMELLVKEEV